MSDTDEFDEFMDKLDDLLKSAPKSAVVVAVAVNNTGHYGVIGNDFQVTRSQLYQALGAMDQAKLDLLASIPKNRPLREPEPPPDEDDEIDEPIGQA